MMTVRYQTRFRDFLAFHVYHFTRSPFTIGFLLVILLASSVLVWSNSKEEDNLYFKIAVLIITEILILGFMLGFYFVIVVVSFISPKNKAMFAKTTLSLGEDSFVDESPYNRNEYKWPSVQKLASTSGHIFLYLAQYVAIVIPRRAFVEEADWHDFYEFCKRKVSEAK